ncbi:MAG: FISUMP domain-containing protein [Fibrobacterota bacterium]|nr:FISUMP domain-containing protein [Chitinispirillaceae bacterium]
MNLIKCIVIIATTVALCSAANSTLRGKVLNKDGSAIANATVKLLPDGLTTTTSSDGSFSFLPTSTKHVQGNAANAMDNKISIRGGDLYSTCAQRASVNIATYSINGQLIDNSSRIVDAGNSIIRLPSRGAGIFFYHVKIADQTYILKGNTVTGIVLIDKRDLRSKHTKTADVTIDTYTLTVNKEGYIDYNVMINPTVQQEVTIRPSVSEGIVTDIDGNVYQTVRIGNQIWTVENFRATKYNDGTEIPMVKDPSKWGNFNIYGHPEPNNGTPVPQCCYYNNTSNPDTIKKFGMLYNFYVVKTGKLAPDGWRIPDSSEWLAMRNYLLKNPFSANASTEPGLVVKSMAAGTDWITTTKIDGIGNDYTLNNISGFGALPAGYRTGSPQILFMGAGERAYWWTSTEAYPDVPIWFTLYDFTGACNYLAINDAGFGLSVRLIKKD